MRGQLEATANYKCLFFLEIDTVEIDTQITHHVVAMEKVAE